MKRRVAILPLTCLLLAAAMPVAAAGWVYVESTLSWVPRPHERQGPNP